MNNDNTGSAQVPTASTSIQDERNRLTALIRDAFSPLQVPEVAYVRVLDLLSLEMIGYAALKDPRYRANINQWLQIEPTHEAIKQWFDTVSAARVLAEKVLQTELETRFGERIKNLRLLISRLTDIEGRPNITPDNKNALKFIIDSLTGSTKTHAQRLEAIKEVRDRRTAEEEMRNHNNPAHDANGLNEWDNWRQHEGVRGLIQFAMECDDRNELDPQNAQYVLYRQRLDEYKSAKSMYADESTKENDPNSANTSKDIIKSVTGAGLLFQDSLQPLIQRENSVRSYDRNQLQQWRDAKEDELRGHAPGKENLELYQAMQDEIAAEMQTLELWDLHQSAFQTTYAQFSLIQSEVLGQQKQALREQIALVKAEKSSMELDTSPIAEPTIESSSRALETAIHQSSSSSSMRRAPSTQIDPLPYLQEALEKAKASANRDRKKPLSDEFLEDISGYEHELRANELNPIFIQKKIKSTIQEARQKADEWITETLAAWSKKHSPLAEEFEHIERDYGLPMRDSPGAKKIVEAYTHAYLDVRAAQLRHSNTVGWANLPLTEAHFFAASASQSEKLTQDQQAADEKIQKIADWNSNVAPSENDGTNPTIDRLTQIEDDLAELDRTDPSDGSQIHDDKIQLKAIANIEKRLKDLVNDMRGPTRGKKREHSPSPDPVSEVDHSSEQSLAGAIRAIERRVGQHVEPVAFGSAEGQVNRVNGTPFHRMPNGTVLFHQVGNAENPVVVKVTFEQLKQLGRADIAIVLPRDNEPEQEDSTQRKSGKSKSVARREKVESFSCKGSEQGEPPPPAPTTPPDEHQQKRFRR